MVKIKSRQAKAHTLTHTQALVCVFVYLCGVLFTWRLVSPADVVKCRQRKYTEYRKVQREWKRKVMRERER